MEITEKMKGSIDSGCGVLLKWFKSYLTDRKQYVFYNGESSDLKTHLWCHTWISIGSFTINLH